MLYCSALNIGAGMPYYRVTTPIIMVGRGRGHNALASAVFITHGIATAPEVVQEVLMRRVIFSSIVIFVSSIPCMGQVAETPKGLSTSEWSSIRAAYEANRHAAVAVEGGYQARNPGQQWRTRFDGRGFLTTPDAGGWSWGLELVSYGIEGAKQTVVAPTCIDAEGNRVAYQWGDGLTEWYENGQRGLEHGYTVHQRPDGGSSMLQLTLAVRGELRPQVSSDGRDVTFISANDVAVVNYSGLKVFDADGAAVPAWFETAADGLRLTVDDRSARYPLTIDPNAQQAYLKASNTGAGDGFGLSVSVSGDTVVVGAYGESSNATGVNGNQADNSALFAGAAYVFVRSGTTWSQQAYLKASNTGASDQFGYSVAVSGATVVVGALYEDSNAAGVNGNQTSNSAIESGAVYVFVRNGTTWSQQAYLKASNTGAGDRFGYSVSVSGDTVVVGAVAEDSNATGVNGNQSDNSATDSGAAYVFVRSGTTWSQQAYLKASNTDADDDFGESVSVSGDTVVVGAISEDSNATGVNGNQADNSAAQSGAAYVFVRSGVTWSQQAYLKASNTDADDDFGESVSVSGDTVVVGARNESSNTTGVDGNQADNSASGAGAAYVFVRSGVTWTQQAYLKASNTGASDFFGLSVAASGDTVVVGTHREDSNATGVNGNQADNSASGAGAAYMFVFVDSDGDGLLDVYDNCPNISNPGQENADGDSAGDVCDGCISDPNKIAVGQCGCGIPDTDNDGDGTVNCQDGCPYDPNKIAPGTCGCGVPDAGDEDMDGVLNCVDNCPPYPNPSQADCDGNGVGDECDIVSHDCNNNGVVDSCETEGGSSADCNRNLVPDECEVDCNANTITDYCEMNVPNSGSAITLNGVTGFVRVPGFGAIIPNSEITIEFWQKADAVRSQSSFGFLGSGPNNRFQAHVPWSDGRVYWDFGNIATTGRLSYLPPQSVIGSWQHFAFAGSQAGQFRRIFRNGQLEASDNGPTAFVSGNWDFAIGSFSESQAIFFQGSIDEFRVWNVVRTTDEIQQAMNRRLVGNEPGLIAYWRFDEGAGGTAVNSAGPQGSNDGLIQGGASWVGSTAPIFDVDVLADCNGNGIPDECDLVTELDCNLNSVPDSCDLANGSSHDCNGNTVPDSCEIAANQVADCNANGIPDDCDIASGASEDCDTNGVLDECDFAAGFDCNNNGVLDSCEYFDCVGIVPGDMNCDGVLNGDDIPAFIHRVTAALYTCQCDLNHDFWVDEYDIPSFVSLLLTALFQ